MNEFAERIACFMFQATFAEDLSLIHDRIDMMRKTVDVSIKTFQTNLDYWLTL